jgi:ATP-dependent helicase/nuclease subunit B
MLLYYANKEYMPDMESISREDMEAIAARLPQHPLSALVLPRVERHQNPPTSVSIKSDEPAFDDVSLDSITGEAHQTHELDLQAQCGLKYYYYQFLYNFTGDEPDRKVPKYYSQAPHWRLGQIPYIVRENYADSRYVNKWRDIVTELLPDRQSETDGLAQFDSKEELRDWVRSQDRFDGYDMNTIYPNLDAERDLVVAELESGVERDWRWRSGGVVKLDGRELAVPAYRLDRVKNGDEYAIPVFFTRFSRRARSALKSCFEGSIWEHDERTGELCLDCGKDDCNYHSKYVIDHRMLAGHLHEADEYGSKVVGIGLQEQYAGPDDGNRVVAIQTNYTDIVSPDSGEEFEQLVPRGYPQNWDSNIEEWGENFLELADTLDTADDGSIELSANPDIVNLDDCLDCVYRSLCQVPDSEVDL